jgi:hypothetical protein
MNDRSTDTRDQPSGDPDQLTLDVLACHLALLINAVQRISPIQDQIQRLYRDLGILACYSRGARAAIRLLTKTWGGDGDTMDPERVARRLRALRGSIATRQWCASGPDTPIGHHRSDLR